MIKILKSALVIGIVGIFAFSATKAVWSDSGQSTGNTFAAGTLNLKLSDNSGPETNQDNVSITWNGIAMTPGGATFSEDLRVKNVGDPGADHVHFSVVNDIVEGAGVGADASDPMDKNLEITSLLYDGEDLLAAGYLTNLNGNGWVDLDDWESLGVPGIGDDDGDVLPDDGTLPLEDLNTDHTLSMTVQLNAASTDVNQGDLVTTDMTATLHQVDGQ